ncbi:glycosyltransferase [Bacillus sp. sid0103]|uniref:glycosyltransferase family 2 protein n=1 Tax=Bacillus sp. sid0103 TaxID=2856337 RepID=UPI001C460241|nr:glycosyltransferase family 2 protein [Bacillus sp. sid0103]MBV7506480.1 glycosyltransferase [Bacillus sp. sid0103]
MGWIWNQEQKHNAKGYHIVDQKLTDERKPTVVSVITPVYNAEKYLRKTIDSVLNQSLGMDQIEYILIDDCSTDSSREILLEYSAKVANIKVVFLKRNTGTPGQPRNIGIELSQSKYITFLDADDWLEPNGLKSLVTILAETGDDYAVGKTIQVQSKGISIVGEHESCKERRSVSPFSIPHIFHHLGPRARMIKTSIIKDNQILFPEMKFAEDKQFFMDVLTHCHTISTTEHPIYYLNRIDNQDTRLSNRTNIIQKTNCNLNVINHILNKNLDVEKQKMVLNRLYEFDSITRFFNTPHFQKTKLKRVYYYKFNQVLKTTKNLNYEVSEEFFHPINKVVYNLFSKKKYKDLEHLFAWDKQEKIKDILIKDNLPYMIVPFLEDNDKYIRIPMHSVLEEEYGDEDQYTLTFKVFGDHQDTLTHGLIRDTKNALHESTYPVSLDKSGNGTLTLDFELLNQLPSSNYSIFLRFNDYLKINIRKPTQSKTKYHYKNREFTFYDTVYGNVGLKISSIK